ncbi:hypothetical protein [Parasphingorhabdus cellanae]|uniref:Uncharacterized protein n=1 Tax=Parasphingorhabdus cellanae TaxID=2806553 RepID=A0ABX7T156_9SPHN|nr:hypothetical protein [Parasphingorhabdus cellanae]QTD55298.1 hypothetical protein J4G78_13900 [Parasphingorhabdus cellanae]
MDKKSDDIARHSPAAISKDAMAENISARTPANASASVDPAKLETAEQFEASSASEKAQQLPGRMLVIAGAGLFIWIVIAIGILLIFF